MEEKFKLSEELESIFKDSVKFAKDNKCKEIPLEVVEYFILKKYLIEEDGTDQFLNEFIFKLGIEPKVRIETVESIEKMLKDKFSDNYFESPLPENLRGEDLPMIMSSALEASINRARLYHVMFNPVKEGDTISTEIVISTSSLLLSTIFEINDISYHVSKLGITKENILKLMIKNNICKVATDDDPSDESMKIKNVGGAVDGINLDDDDPYKVNSEDEEFESAGKVLETAGGVRNDNSTNSSTGSNTPYLDEFSTDITKSAKEGILDPVIGRERELQQIVEILCCRTKNNCFLLGASGTGKSSTVNLLAQKIASGDVPDMLKNKRILSLDLLKMLKNTKFRGEYENNVSNILSEVAKNKDIIIYVEEAHSMVSAGASSEGGGFIEMIKPSLARGEFQLIADTTWDDYRKHIEKDKAIVRRFQKVIIEEPSKEDTIKILKGVSGRYSKFHKVKYSNEVFEACVNLSERYIFDRFNPDRSIECLDIAGALANINSSRPTYDSSEEDRIVKELDEKVKEKVEAVNNQEFDDAAKIREKELELRSSLDKIRKEKTKFLNDPKNWPEVTIDDVVEVVSRISNVPVNNIKRSDMDKVRETKKLLESEVIGQQEAIDKLTLNIQRNILGLRDNNKPIASIMALGRTGIGKSLIASKLAETFFGSEKNLIRINLNELKDKTGVEALLGAKPGYVSYGTYEPLLDKVRRMPYCVLLLDEVDKLDNSVFDIFLDILDSGKVKLSNGDEVNFRNSIIIFTGNVGTRSLTLKGEGIGFSKLTKEEKLKDDKDTVLEELKKTFRPEFLNRLSDVIVFNGLGTTELKEIFNLELNKLKKRLKEKGLKISVTNRLRDQIISACDLKYGARDLQRNIVKYIENEICNTLLSNPVDLNTISCISLDFNEKVEVTFIDKDKKSKKKKESIKTVEVEEGTKETPIPAE